MKALLGGFPYVFSASPPGLQLVGNGIDHAIPLIEIATPPFKLIFRLSKPECLVVQDELAAILSKGYIQPSSLAFFSPILFVLEKNGSLKIVIDRRAVNRLAVKNRYPISNIDNLIH